MTILGRHTVNETRDLIRATEFRVNQNLDLLRKIQMQRMNPPTVKQVQLDDDMAAFVKRWTRARDNATLAMAATVVAAPAVPLDVLPAETEYQMVDGAVRADIPHLKDIQDRIEAEAKALGLGPLDLSKTPGFNSPDADFAALKKLDVAIKQGENAASSAAKSNTGLLIGAGVLGVVGIVVATKVYL